MAYRDELEAAQARIAALERQLAEQQAPNATRTGPPHQEIQALQRQLAAKNHKLQEQELQIQALKSGLQAHERQIQTHQDESQQLQAMAQELREKRQALETERNRLDRMTSNLQQNERKLFDLSITIEQQNYEITALKETLKTLQKKAGEISLLTLTEYNRSQIDYFLEKQGAKVLCPRCYALGEQVEMKLGFAHSDDGCAEVRCPKCLLQDQKKLR